MRRHWRWTVIYRGHYFRNIINAFNRIMNFMIIFMAIIWDLSMLPITIALWILGVDWYEIQMKFYRKIKVLFT